MSAQDVFALQQVVVAKGVESNSASQSATQSHFAADGTGGFESKSKGRKKRLSDSFIPSNSLEKVPTRPEQSFPGFPLPANGNPKDDSSHHGSEAVSHKSEAKTPKSSRGGRVSRSRKRKSKDKGREIGQGEEYELDGLASEDEQLEQPKFYRRRRFWTFQVPLLWSFLTGVIGVMLRIFSPWRTASHLQLWRFFIFFACLPLIYVAANYVLLCFVWFFESQFFTTSNVLYFVIALKSPARFVIMGVLLLPLYIPLFLPQSTLSSGANLAYHRVLSVIACVIVFTGMNFLKVLFAKLMSSYFHSSTHFIKMQEALDKEYHLKLLATPRDGNNTFVELMNPEGEAKEKADDKKPFGIGSTAPGRLVTKVASQVGFRTAGRKRASSLPTPASMENLTEERAARVEAEKQGTSQRRPPPLATARSDMEDTSSHKDTFEPPDPVLPPTPPDTRASPESPSPFAYLSKSSAPIAGPTAASTVRSSPGTHRQIVHFQKTLPLQRSSSGQASGGSGQLARRNSDGGAGVAGILQDMEFAVGQGHPGGERIGASVFPSTALQAAVKAQHRISSQDSLGRDDRDHDMRSSKPGRREGSASTWARHRWSERTPSAIREEMEPASPGRLPVTAEEMTNEQGTALVATIHQVEKHLRKRQMNIPFADQLKGQGGSSEQDARKLAFFIFWNVKPFFDRNYIVQSDLEAFMSQRRAAEAFEMLDRDGDNQVTLSELRKSIQEIFDERANLSVQLRDTKSVVSKLELVIGVALHICAIFFYLMIFGVDIQNVWVLFTSIFLGFAFIFGNSIKNLFEAVLYLFVQHPFDVGDTLVLDNGDRVQVEEISLSTIVMRRGDGVRLWVPTTQLVPKTCQNISRSDNKSEGFKFLVDLGVSASVLQEVNRRVGEFVEARDTDFSPGHSVQLTACADPLKVALNVGFEFSHNGVDGGKMGQARSDLLQVVSDTLRELQVVYSQAPLRTISG